MRSFFELFPKARVQVTNQGVLTIKVAVQDKYTGEWLEDREIKRALLAYKLNAGEAHGSNGKFIIEV
jgi:hypothetical protein